MFSKRAVFVPESLHRLGFTGNVIQGQQVIIPPAVTIKAGPFLMGSLPTDPQAYDQEKPQHTVTLSEYHMSKYPITVAEYTCAIRAGVVTEPQPVDLMGMMLGRKPINWETQVNQFDHPVVGVTLGDFVRYTRWLSALTSQRWRLPTEAEWEKAARGTDGRTYPWGNHWDPARANTGRIETEDELMKRLRQENQRKMQDPNAPALGFEGGRGITAVGAYPTGASHSGVVDMVGNVWEITTTVWPSSYPYNPTDGRDNLTAPVLHVLRGGAWYDPERFARCACRYSIMMPRDHFGARMVK